MMVEINKNEGWAWGLNTYGQLGDGTNSNKNNPVQVDNTNLNSEISATAGGYLHSLALKSDGTVWSWGYNGDGQLGDGTNINRNTPVQVDNTNLNSDVIAIACGYAHSLALKLDGTVWSWGLNDYGQLGDGTNINRNTPVQVDNTNLASNIVAITGGGLHGLALKTDGTVWAWGLNSNGQLGDGTNINRNTPVQVDNTNLASNIVAIVGGGYHSLVLRTDETVWSWGDNYYGQLGNGTNSGSNIPVHVVDIDIGRKVIVIAGGVFHSLAITSLPSVKRTRGFHF